MTFAIVGYGKVGRATRAAAEYHGHECVAIVDPRALMDAKDCELDGYLPPAAFGDPREADFAFVCVNTPPAADGACDTSNVRDAVRDLCEQGFKGAIVIRSTVPPGTCASLAAEFDGNGARRFLSNPEFLRMRDTEHTSRWPTHVVIGSQPPVESNEWARQLRYFYLPYFEHRANPPVFVTDWATAEFYKYASNALLALAIIGAEELAQIAGKLGADWNTCYSIAQHCPVTPKAIRVDPEDHGFGGACLPKDLDALLEIARKVQVCPHTLAMAATINDRLRQQQEAHHAQHSGRDDTRRLGYSQGCKDGFGRPHPDWYH